MSEASAKAVQVDPASITDEKVMQVLKEVVAENPDRVYDAPEHQLTDDSTTCFYVHTDDLTGEPVSPGCLVGQVLNRLGLPLHRLEELEGYDAPQAVTALGLPVSGRTLRVLGQAQQFQDSGKTWGEAYARTMGEGI
ncbi:MULTISPECIES: hypothetical protein [unclassified Streptomyces]|uniref:hypothetical protein n=1 Tax=unclassified Streptomyces TaxID=2593676 RepID=UPI00081EB367|nr:MULTISPECIES: hypothetical protein [unclassified Streptomyces]MYR95440.1 hypothetical protein [Streptomyces sp. SID4937]SCD90403.1 hypothetical protein GA0115243_104720 [Streptomyces sp. ScaeMP-e83]